MSRDQIQTTLRAITSARACGRDRVTLERFARSRHYLFPWLYLTVGYNTNPGNKIMTILNFVLRQ